jgi:large subunit ribosomal protein L25
MAAPAVAAIAATKSTVRSKIGPVPGQLVRFLEKYPINLYSAKYTGITIAVPLTRRLAKEARIAEAAAANEGSEDVEEPESKVNLPMGQTTEAIAAESIPSQSPIPTTDGERIVDGNSRASRFPPNPFLPFKNPATGRWQGSRISLRVQADLVKMAKKHGIENLLPPGRKSTAFKQKRILERGLRVKGTGEGEKVKGHAWERKLPELLEKRKKALEEMPALVREWEARGHGRGWKKWPKVRGPR